MKQSTQNYLKTIYTICLAESKQCVKVSEISKKLDISAPAVTDMVKKLESAKLLKNIPYKGVELTPKGEKIGRNMVRHHRLWESYLHAKLDVPWDKVHDEAERLEHACSDYLIDRIEEELDFPQFDPHGNPIPDKNGNVPQIKNEQILSSCTPDTTFRLIRVVDMHEQFLEYLDKMGVHLGDKLIVKTIMDFDGSFICEYKHEKLITFSAQAAERVFVKVC